MLKKYVKSIPQAASSIIYIVDTPTNIIYDDAQNLDKQLISTDDSIAIRIPDDYFCFSLSRKLNGALIYTYANISGQPTQKSFKEIAPAILKGVDYVVNLHNDKSPYITSSISGH